LPVKSFFLLYSVFGTWPIYLLLYGFCTLEGYHKWAFSEAWGGIYDTI